MSREDRALVAAVAATFGLIGVASFAASRTTAGEELAEAEPVEAHLGRLYAAPEARAPERSVAPVPAVAAPRR